MATSIMQSAGSSPDKTQENIQFEAIDGVKNEILTEEVKTAADFKAKTQENIQFDPVELVSQARDRRKALLKIIETYGYNSQIDVAIEELSELIKALIKYRRAIRNKEKVSEKIAEVTEEIADVWIMLSQLEIIFLNAGEVARIEEFKIRRQLERIAENDKEKEIQEDE